MKETGIIFSGPMVRAILDGRKTQTRRIIKPQPKLIESSGRWYWEKALDVHGSPLVDASRRWWEYYGTSPYGKPDDRLYVRETWRPLEYPLIGTKFDYRENAEWRGDAGRYKWKPSIHMPREASRLTLELTDVRVERLQDISEADAIAEGTEPYSVALLTDDEIELLDAPLLERGSPYRNGYALLWDSLNAKRAPWDSNPWVWVLEFRRAA